MVPGELVVRRGIRVSRQRMGGRVRLVRVERGEFLAVFDVVSLEDDVLGDGPARVGDRDDLGVRAAGVAAAEAPEEAVDPPGFEPLATTRGRARRGERAARWSARRRDRRRRWSRGGGRRARLGYTARARRSARRCSSAARKQPPEVYTREHFVTDGNFRRAQRTSHDIVKKTGRALGSSWRHVIGCFDGNPPFIKFLRIRDPKRRFRLGSPRTSLVVSTPGAGTRSAHARRAPAPRAPSAC